MSGVNEKIIFLLLDAFRHDYINAIDTPFLYQGTKRGVYGKKLRSTTGFTQRTAIFTGSKGSETGAFTMFNFDADNSPFKFLEQDGRWRRMRATAAIETRLPSIPGLRRVKRLLREAHDRRDQAYRSWIQTESKKFASHASPAHIPFEVLPLLGVSEDHRPIHQAGAYPDETIFDKLYDKQIAYKFFMYPAVNGEDEKVLKMLLEEAGSSTGMLLGQFSDSDALVHQCGPSAWKRREVTGEIDRKLREIAAHYGSETTWVIIGDHGMTDVVEEINVTAEIGLFAKKHDVRPGKDFVMFLDSTMARFRWLSEKGRRFLEQVPEISVLQAKGNFVDDNMAAQYSIPIRDRKYGDLIWWANIGVLVFPDYFHDRFTRNKGMHGYDSDHDDMKGFFLALGPNINPQVLEEVELIDVCPSLCAVAGVRPPQGNRGKTLLV
jgi:predicted AlkP superfamily pyrophosphatase or phosphodiesterase